jgi:hypothetical protein
MSNRPPQNGQRSKWSLSLATGSLGLPGRPRLRPCPPDGPFHRVGVELDPTILEVAAEGLPADQGIADGIGEPTAGCHPMKFRIQPELQRLKERLGQLHANHAAQLSRPATDPVFDGVELTDPTQRLGGDRRAGRLMHLVELARSMSPAGGKHDAMGNQLLEPRIAIDLQRALEPLQMRDRAFGLAIGAEWTLTLRE